jgi:hypothetical protein
MKRTLIFTLTISLLFGLAYWSTQLSKPAQAAMQATYPLNPASFTSLGASPFTSAGTYTINASKNNAAPILTKPDNTTINGVFFNSTGGEIAVFTFNSIDIPAGVTVQGLRNANSRPIALLSQSSITIAGVVDVSGETISGALNGGAAGPGGAGGGGAGGDGGTGGAGGVGFVNGNPGGANNAGSGGGIVAGGGGGGGVMGTDARGAFATGGGGGGFGGPGLAFNFSSTVVIAGGIAYGNLATTLQGGSGGGGAASINNPLRQSAQGGGGGGGAVEIGASGDVTITGSLRANGGGSLTGAGNFPPGKGGAGAGGGIVIHGTTVDFSSAQAISAQGGSGNVGAGGGRVHVAAGTINEGCVNLSGGYSVGGNGVYTFAGTRVFYLNFEQQPPNGNPLIPFNPVVKVSVRNGCGPITDSTASITLALGNNPTGATLGGTLTKPVVNGVATFDDLTVSKNGTGYTLIASSSGLSNSTSDPFDMACQTITLSATEFFDATVGTSYGSGVSAAPFGQDYNFSVTAGTFPNGLTLSSLASFGNIDGTPTVSGTFNFTITATHLNGCSGSRPYQLKVFCPTFTVGTPTATGALGQSYSSSAAASPAAPSGFKYQYSLANGTPLPSGLTLNSSTGAISGTPTVGGNRSFDIKAELLTTGNAATGCSDTKTRSINASCPSFTVASPAGTGTPGVSYSSSAAASPAAPSGFNYQYSVASGALPDGVLLNATTGALSGTPTASGAFNFAIKAELFSGATATGCSVTQTGSITVACPAFTVGTPTGTSTVGANYSSSAAASPAASSGFSYRYALTNNTTLPPGLTLDANSGALTGIPTVNGAFSFAIKAELFNSSNVATGCSDTQTRNLNVTCPTITVGTPSGGALGIAYSSSVVANPLPNGFNYQYSLANNTALPGGLTLNATTGAITGTPSTSGNSSFDLKAELFNGATSSGCSVTQTRTISVTCVTNPVVTNLNDSGAGSLREAIARACAGSTITFAPGLSGTLTLTSGDLVILRSLTIQGPGANLLTISGNHTYRIFTLLPETSGHVRIAGLRLINGNGQTTETSLGNSGAGGAITVITSNSTLTLLDATVSGNTAGLGGGLATLGNTATVNLIRSTIAGNTATGSYGGGLSLRATGTVNVVNSTIAGNQAAWGGGISHTLNVAIITLNLVNSTITGNQATKSGGGIDGFPNLAIQARNSLVALNGGTDIFSDGGFSSNGYNLLGTFGGSLSTTLQPTDQVGVNPLLELDGNGKPLLANNGGPTPTIRLLPGSPAIDKGATANDPLTNQPLTTDQRGQTRPYDFPGVPNASGGNGSDIGAYEYNCAALSLASLPNGVAGVGYTASNLASGGLAPYTLSVSSGTLPLGVLISGNGLTGTPMQAGTFSFTLLATDAYGCTGSQSYALTIGCPSLTLTPMTLANGVLGTAYNQTLTASPAGGNYSYAVTVGSLPPGLTLNGTTGVLSGAPTAGGSYAFAVTTTGWGACTRTQSYNLLVTGTCSTITVNPTSLPAGALGTAYTQTVSATGGTTPYSYSIATGALPAGLTLNASMGELSGTPTTSGTFVFTIRATGQGGCTGQRSYVLSIGCGTLTFAPASLPGGIKGAAYSQQLSVSPANSATFSILLGSLPPGFMLSSTGLLSGTTAQAGTYNFTVKALAGSCQGTKAYSLVIGTGSAALALSGDYDGDGKTDPALWSAKDGVWRILKSSTQQTVSQVWGTAGDVTLLGDYDGDGKSDLAVFRPGVTEGATFYVKRSSDGGFLVKAWGLSTDVPVPGDYDGDGKTDLAVFRPSEGNWYIQKSIDGSYAVQAWGAGYLPYNDVPVSGDYDGDGKSDVAVFRRANGMWLIKRSSDGQYTTKIWGIGTDVPVAADYDGDGQTDIAVWRPAEGNWYVLRSGDQRIQVSAWGSTGDVVTPGDYDGDGLSDLTVWRAPEQKWYLRQSAGQTSLVQAQGQRGDTPVSASARPGSTP